MASNPAQKRYTRRILLSSLGYGISLFGTTFYFRDHPGANGGPAYLSAIVPALCIVAMFVAIGRYLVEESDEYQRMLMVRQSLIASGLALTVATIWGFLESADLVAHFDTYWIAVIWFGGLGLGACINKLTIGAAE